jgi:glycosyltransferase involved in cell wall biosynthesis
LIPWLPQSELAAHYRGADLLLFPSRFDTFGCVVLEAMACGCPVLAYNCKGPKDIIEHGRDGYLVNSVEEAVSMIKIHGQKQRQDAMRQSAMLRAKEYSATEVMIRLLMDVGIPSPQGIKCDEPGFMG